LEDLRLYKFGTRFFDSKYNENHKFTNIISSYGTNITHLELYECPNLVQLCEWEKLVNLVNLKIHGLFDGDRVLLRISSLKNLRYLSIGSRIIPLVEVPLVEVPLVEVPFPELKYLKFNIYLRDKLRTDKPDKMMNRIKALEYCCANSPKLEKIHFICAFELKERFSEELSDYLANSIGSLLKRPALRSLFMRLYNVRNDNSERFKKLIQYVLNYSEEKPNLENLTLEFNFSPIPLLSSVHEFVDNNFNLKSLSLYGVQMTIEMTKEMTQELIKILSCNHSLEEFRLDCCYWKDLWTKRLWKADEFPELIEKLEKCLE